MKRQLRVAVCSGLIIVGFAGMASGDVLSIRDVQYTADPGGDSPYNGQIHDVTGGIVTHIFQGFKPRVFLQRPDYSAWGGITVKDWEGGDLANNVNIGDWVSLSNILIEEYRGNTLLQYNKSWVPQVSFTVISTGNPVPDPVQVSAADLPVPVDHDRSERYEAMVVTLDGLLVGQKDLGKAGDNYELWQAGSKAWGSDYMNLDAGGPYDPRIQTGATLARVTGLVEQYTKLSDGWDYYQVVTRSADDIVAADVIPTVSEWGVAVLTLLLLTTAKVAFRRRRWAPQM